MTENGSDPFCSGPPIAWVDPTMKTLPLSDLGASLVEFTKQPGKLRCLLPGEPVKRAQGLYFLCPKCYDPKHGITILFDLESVPKNAKPHGRWRATPGPISNLTIEEKIQSPTNCGWSGIISQGRAKWR